VPGAAPENIVNVTTLLSDVVPAASDTLPIALFDGAPEFGTIPELDVVVLRKKSTVEPEPNVPPDTNATVDVPVAVPAVYVVGFTVNVPLAAYADCVANGNADRTPKTIANVINTVNIVRWHC